MVQTNLKKILLGARIVFEELEKVFREIELSLNNRPLTFTYEIGYEVYRLTRVKKSIHTLEIIYLSKILSKFLKKMDTLTLYCWGRVLL